MPMPKGFKMSEETKRKMSDAHKGKTTWNKGLHVFFGDPSKRFQKGCTPWNKGTHLFYGDHEKTGFKKGNAPWNKGLTPETDSRVARLAEKSKGRKAWNSGTKGVCKSNLGSFKKNQFRGKTYEELYGVEKATEKKKKQKLGRLGCKHPDSAKLKISANGKKMWSNPSWVENHLKKLEATQIKRN